MSIFNSLLTWLIRRRIRQIELFMKYPEEVQLEWFHKLLHRAKNTEWGKKYEYNSIRTPEEYRHRVPLHEYESLKPYIERLQHGEKNLLWPGEIKWFAKSSGTSGSKSKLIPVSFDALEKCHFNGGRDMLAIYFHNHPDSKIFSGKGLIMGGSRSITRVNHKNYYTGDLSAILIQNLPFWVRLKSTPDISTVLMEDWEQKIDKMARITVNHDVTSITGVPSWTLVLIKKILEITGKNNLSEIWPHLEVFFHGGVSFNPYRNQFHQLIPSEKMTYVETYNASEGFFGIQDRTNADDLLLMLDYGIYYEFIPMDEYQGTESRTITLADVQPNVQYAMVISTNGGLWRYILGDTVMFTTLRPYRIKITGRTRNYINAFGEELIVDNAERAMAIAAEQCHAVVSEFTAAPVYFSEEKNKAAHEWIIEFEVPPRNIDSFKKALDDALKSLNSDYEAKRYKNLLLDEPVIRIAPRGTFYQWMKKLGKLGGQHKVPRLFNDRRYVDDLLTLL